MARFDGIAKKADGTFEIIEAKMGGGKLTDNQRAVLNALKNNETITAVGENAEKNFGAGSSGTNVLNKLTKSVNLNNVTQTLEEVLTNR